MIGPYTFNLANFERQAEDKIERRPGGLQKNAMEEGRPRQTEKGDAV